MKAIISGGGPLICIELEVASQWRGTSGTAAAVDNVSKDLNDYARACRINDYLGEVSLGDRSALVLGDMPLETLIWQPAQGLPRIVRIYYGDAGVNMIDLLESAGDLDFDDPDEALSIEFKSSRILIFDAAYPGVDETIDRLSFELPPGKYLAITKRFQPDERTSILVHRFVPSH